MVDGNTEIILGCSAAGQGLCMDSLKESVTLENNFVRSLCRDWLLWGYSDFFLMLEKTFLALKKNLNVWAAPNGQ